MKDKLYEKTENGYILRQRKTTAIVVIVCIICLGLMVVGEWVVDKPQVLNIWIVGGLSLAFIAIIALVLRTECSYLVIVDKGVYWHSPLSRTNFIAWKDIRDWGIAHQRTRYSTVYCLYFSKKPLKSTSRGSNKKIPLYCKTVLYIDIEFSDFFTFQHTKVIPFCLQRLSSNTDVPTMFTSDHVKIFQK